MIGAEGGVAPPVGLGRARADGVVGVTRGARGVTAREGAASTGSGGGATRSVFFFGDDGTVDRMARRARTSEAGGWAAWRDMTIATRNNEKPRHRFCGVLFPLRFPPRKASPSGHFIHDHRPPTTAPSWPPGPERRFYPHGRAALATSNSPRCTRNFYHFRTTFAQKAGEGRRRRVGTNG